MTFHILLNYVSPIIKLADLHKACQTSKGGGMPSCPPPSGCATAVTYNSVATSYAGIAVLHVVIPYTYTRV